MPVTIDYYMSLTSPWTYLGSAPFAVIAMRNGATVNIKPCKFGPIFEQTGGVPPPHPPPPRRGAAAAEALAAAAGLPDDGVEALARGAGHAHQSRAEAFSL